MLAGATLEIEHRAEVDFLRGFAFTPEVILQCCRAEWILMKTAGGLRRGPLSNSKTSKIPCQIQ